MKYVPKDVDQSVNRPQEHPLVDFLWLIGGTAVGVGLLVYLAIHLSSFVANRVSMEKEIALVDARFSSAVAANTSNETQQNLQRLVDQLWLPYSPQDQLRLKSSIDSAPFENAYMGLGGRMAVTTELLKNSETENELGFVICHEIGHFVHRDVIRGLSTRFMLLAALSLLGLSDNNLGIVDAGVNSSLLSYSRNQESRADEFAITCASKKYGHIEGFDTFFMRAKKQNPKVLDSKFFQYMSTHPISDERIKHLVEFAQSRGISSKGPLTKQTLGDKKDQ